MRENVDLTHGVIICALVVVAVMSAPVEGWRGAVVSAAFAVIVVAALWRIRSLVRGWRRGRY